MPCRLFLANCITNAVFLFGALIAFDIILESRLPKNVDFMRFQGTTNTTTSGGSDWVTYDMILGVCTVIGFAVVILVFGERQDMKQKLKDAQEEKKKACDELAHVLSTDRIDSLKVRGVEYLFTGNPSDWFEKLTEAAVKRDYIHKHRYEVEKHMLWAIEENTKVLSVHTSNFSWFTSGMFLSMLFEYIGAEETPHEITETCFALLAHAFANLTEKKRLELLPCGFERVAKFSIDGRNSATKCIDAWVTGSSECKAWVASQKEFMTDLRNYLLKCNTQGSIPSPSVKLLQLLESQRDPEATKQ